MATILNTLYPPQVNTFMPSFCYNNSAEIWFNISSYNEDKINQIKFIHVSMVDQRNNINVFAGKNGNTTVYPQYYPINFEDAVYDNNKKMYKISIPPQVLKTAPYYNVGQYYKIQLRFDLTIDSTDNPHKGPTAFFYLNNNNKSIADALGLASYTNENEDNFSEWSTGTLIKPILIPEPVLNLEKMIVNTETREIEINSSTDIPIIGTIYFKDTDNKNGNEQLSWYQIKILNYYDSGKIYTSNNEINDRLDTSMLIPNQNGYNLQIIYCVDINYIGVINYLIKIKNYDNNYDTNQYISYINDSIIYEEEGIITLNITSTRNQGKLIIRRTSHYSNFKYWDLIGAYNLPLSNNNLIIVDDTIESMTGYRYQLQIIDGDTVYKPMYIKDEDILHCDFYGGLFSDINKKLKISFDFQISNRINAANRTKTDTLGGQYPIFTQNSKLKYHTYSISGKISSEDNGELFLPKINIFGDEYYNYRYPLDENIASPHESECQSIKPNNDWLYEREYRDAVEEWLNNGKPKLFRSMTEGNMIVMLDGVSLTPDTTLGRRLYNFSATMYEIGNGKDINSIASFGLFNIKDERLN